MKTLYHRALKPLAFLFLIAGLAPQADARLVTYQFTGTQYYSSGNAGTTISGTITLDVGAASDNYYPFDYSYDDGSGYSFHSRGFYENWQNGEFSINAMTDTGLEVGTALGGNTAFQNSEIIHDESDHGNNYHSESSVSQIYHDYYDATGHGGVGIYGKDPLAGGVTPGLVPNPWNPAGNEFSLIYLYNYNHATGEVVYANYTIDSFTLVPTTICIDGIDTGITDFQYQGKLVSQHLADCAAAAKNHGDYVSCVAKLTDALKKAGLLTNNQKQIIMNAAAKSSVGK